MQHPSSHKKLFIILLCSALFSLGCKKEYSVVSTIKPNINYSYWFYDSVEGVTTSHNFSIDRIMEITYDPNVDKCYMDKPSQAGIDTFDRSPYWKRGYVNRHDNYHRIIFNGDTITIHYPPPSVSTPGNSGFRYTSGIRL